MINENGIKVIVRARDAGVHVGTLEGREDDIVTLSNAVRIWRWRGANTLHELSLHGADEGYTRISEKVPNIAVLGVIEIIPLSPKAAENLLRSRWGE